MNKLFTISNLRLIAAAALAIAAPFSMAHGQPDVSWSISVGSPRPAPQVYYAPPPVVYVQPQPVYVRPRPVYVQPATVVHYGQPYYVEEGRHQKMRRHHWKHRHGHHGHHRGNYDY